MTYIPYPRPRVALASGRRPLFGVLSLSLILSFLVATQPGASLALPRPQPESPALKPSLANLPMAFVPNVGQSETSVQFQAQGLGGMIFFTPDQIVLTLPGNDTPPAAETAAAEPSATLAPTIAAADLAARQSVVRLRFLGANPAPRVQSADPLPGVVNYLLGSDPSQWRTQVPTYAALRYEQLYPGIDLRYDGQGGRLKGTYLVAPGADPSQIRWRYDGTSGLRLDSAGNLEATLPAPEAAASQVRSILREAAPVAWQTIGGQQIPVQVRYEIRPDQTIGFSLGAYDRSLPLVLDPTLDYSSYVGGVADDEGRSIAVDSSGAVYVVGNTNSIAFPDTNKGSYGGGVDTFVTKLNPAGDASIYTSYLGGDNTDLGSGIVIGSGDVVHVTGSTYSSNFPTTPAAVVAPMSATLVGEIDAFVASLGSDGTLSYAAYLGGTRKDFGNGIAIDTAQNLYLTGRTESLNFPAPNGRDLSLGGPADAFIVKLAAADKSMIYGTFLGGGSSDMANAIAVDSGGNSFVTGQTSSTDFPTLGSARPPAFQGGVTDAFVTKLAANGRTLMYSIYLGGKEFDEGMSIALDSESNAYVTGTTQSPNFPALNGYEKFFRGRSDAFASKINVSGSAMEYSTFLGGTSDDAGQDIAVDSQNAAYIIGSTKSYDFPNTNAVQATRNGDIDAFVTKLRPSGSAAEYSSYFGGTIEDYGYGIATSCDSQQQCTAYIVGTAKSRDFPTIEKSWKPNYNGGEFDAFIARFGPVPTGPRLYVQPPMKFIGVNQTFSVDVMVDSADKDLDTVDAYLAFKTEYLQVVDINGNPTTEISPTSSLSQLNVNYNFVDNSAGKIGFSATRLVTDTGQSRLLPRAFKAATIHFRTKKTTTGVAPTTIEFERQGARRSDLYLEGAPRAAWLGNSNIRILSGALLNGKVGFEKRGTPPNPGWTTPLYRGDSNGIVVYENWNTANQQTLGYFRTDTDNNGHFSVFLRDIEGGDYDVQIKSVDTLSNIRRANLQTTDQIDFGTLCVGDSSGDDVINGADLSYLVPFYLTNDTVPNFPTEGDANKDKRIDREDVNAIKENFLRTGLNTGTASSPGCTLTSGQSLATAAPATRQASAATTVAGIATEPATISLYPEDIAVEAGQSFTVSLNVDLKSHLADTVDVYLNVNPNVLELLDKEGRPVSTGSALKINSETLPPGCEVSYNNGVQKTTAHAQGNLSVSCYKQPFLPDSFTLATFDFRVKQEIKPEIKSSRLTLLTEGTSLEDKVRTTHLYKGGVPLEVTRTNAVVTLLAKGSRIYVPLVGW
jgi:hypothetical protein